MMRMGFLFPGMGVFFGILLVSIVVLALLFGANSLRGRTRLNRKNPSWGKRDISAWSIKRKIMQLAQDSGGVLTVSDVVLATGFSMKQAEETLNEMVDGFRIKTEVTDSGIVQYEFSELIKNEERLQSRLP
jgi:ABC-type transport system involved in multi-copper enzyme maturation permease subunit